MKLSAKAEWTELLLKEILHKDYASLTSMEHLSYCRILEKYVQLYKEIVLIRAHVYGYTIETFYQMLDEMVKRGDIDMLRLRSDLEHYVHDRNNLDEIFSRFIFGIHDLIGLD